MLPAISLKFPHKSINFSGNAVPDFKMTNRFNSSIIKDINFGVLTADMYMQKRC